MTTDPLDRALSVLALLETEFCQDDRSMQVEALRCEFESDARQIDRLRAQVQGLEQARDSWRRTCEKLQGELNDSREELSSRPTSEAYNAACEALWGHRDRAEAAEARLAECLGCITAAEIEGLQEALAETTDERLKDLVERRLLWVRIYAAPAQKGEG